MTFNKIIFIALGLGVLAVSCKKEGLGGQASVSGLVKHHSQIVGHAVVYIKYGATEFPGDDIAKYDASTTADASAHYEFTQLRKGDYYLYATAYDSANTQSLDGGIGVVLKKSDVKSTDIPVSE